MAASLEYSPQQQHQRSLRPNLGLDCLLQERDISSTSQAFELWSLAKPVHDVLAQGLPIGLARGIKMLNVCQGARRRRGVGVVGGKGGPGKAEGGVAGAAWWGAPRRAGACALASLST